MKAAPRARVGRRRVRENFVTAYPPCFGPGCGLQIEDPRAYRQLTTNPWDPTRRAGPPSLLFANEGRFFASTVGGVLEMTDALPIALRAAVGDPATVWNRAVEPDPRPDEALAIGLPNSLGASAAPSVVSVSDGQLSYDPFRSRVVPAPDGEVISFPTSGSPTPDAWAVHGPASALTGYAAAFSARHRRVLVAGGRNAGGMPSHELLKFDFREGEWSLAVRKASPSPTGQVLDLTYDSTGSVAYVLFVDDRVARLVAYDLVADSARVLLSVPHVRGLHRAVYLTMLPGGAVAITATRTHSHQIFRFDTASRRVTAVAAGLGSVITRPHVAAGALWLPVAVGASLNYEQAKLYPGGGGSCTQL